MPLNVIESKKVHELVTSKDAILIDVREPAENRACSIADAYLLPLGKINVDLINELKQNHIKENKVEPKVIIHCQKGIRGTKACKKLLKQTSELQLHNLEGGIEAWQAVGLPVNKTENGVLPLDRQVQITIGSVVLISSLIAYFININFVFLSAFFGAGLLFAGLSGFCGLARVIAKMPWNQSTGDIA